MRSIDKNFAFTSGMAAALALGIALGCVSARAGEPAPVAAVDPAKTADADAVLAAEEPAFNFDPQDRRDPFTFTKVVAPTAKVSSGNEPGATSDGGPKKVMRADEVEAKRREAETFYLKGERNLMETESAKAVADCDRGLEVFKEIPNIGDYRDLQDVRERLFRLRKASDRMRLRQDAEREFLRLNIKVTGIVARERNSQAIINASIVNKGDLVATVGDSNDVVVIENILPDQIVFLFRGYRIAQTFSEYAK